MDFSISDRMQDILGRAGELMESVVLPMEESVMRQGFVASAGELDAARARVKEAGLWAPQLPTEIGGMGLSVLEHGMMSEVLGRSPLGHYVFGAQAPDAGNIEILHEFGTPEQKERWLAPLANGDIRSCFSMTEPDTAGSNPTLLECRAEKDGDDYVINGRKWFTSAADGAAFAIVMAVTNPDAPAHGRASQIIVPTDTPGFRLVRNIPVMGHAGEGYASHGEIEYENCRVPRSNLLGQEGAGFLIAQKRLGPGRIHHCMRWMGICERAFELMVKRAGARDMGGGRTLGTKQIVQAWIAEARAKINAARLMVLDAAWAIDNQGFYAAREKISLIKFYCADVLMEVIDRAVQVHGAKGITDDTVLAYYYSHERGARIYDGPDEVHKVVVAKRIINRYTHGVDSSSFKGGSGEGGKSQ
jgi:alkylation response protein AidB-like acyl-CoA dehydrogenase